MELRGRAIVDAPRAVVFEAIFQPATLLAVVPGCRSVERIDGDHYRAEIAIRVPGLAGTYDAAISVLRRDAPAEGALDIRLEGRSATIVGVATFRLEQHDGSTTVEYEGQATVSGPLARLDERFVAGVAGSLVEQGLERLGRRLALAERAATAATTATTAGAGDR